ncbi:cupin domain-containing protein [Roseobacter sp. YSTF-M11]|uniref:Cupin domain-containing protein n=1 Tax=Roseobacter insulae TaxID=2859783 RepID=A0A9X1FRC5_9RHOB|nr:cupin domain-containing protein [Roseobacter insulae]MBW4706371.1 cupin domain-containing protein [Roseobacter insulae]
MKKYFVGRVNGADFCTPAAYHGRSEGYVCNALIGAETNPACVLTGVGLVRIAPAGGHDPVFHAFEKGFYILKGEVVLEFHGRAHRLKEGHYGVIHKAVPYTLHNPGDGECEILEMCAPQPKAEDHSFTDTFFRSGSRSKDAPVVDLEDPTIKFLGFLPNENMKADGESISAVGVRSSSIWGISLKELVDRMLGAEHQALFMVQFAPGGAGTTHDHPLEEIYFIMSGQAKATLDGEEFIVGPGDYVWTGVGCFHQFECYGDEPVRWIETQAPLPAGFETFRFRREWDPLATATS